MKTGTLILLVVVAASLAAAPALGAGEVKVVVALELLEKGEHSRVISMKDYYVYRSDYEEFKALLEKAVTLASFAEHGWRVVHAERLLRDDYYMMILER